jgi:hypothetical protein
MTTPSAGYVSWEFGGVSSAQFEVAKVEMETAYHSS